MNRHFLRLYASIGAAVLAALVLVWTVDVLALRPDEVDPGLWTEAEAATRHAYATLPADEAERSVEQRYRVHLHLLPPDAPAAPPLRGLRAPPPGREVTLDDGRRVAIHGERPPPPLGPPAAALVALLGAAGALTRWVRSLDRSLAGLTDVARRFGDEDLAARAPVDPRRPTHELDVAFNQMAERVQGLVKSREDLLAGVSHELRTPLTRLRFAVELLATDPDDRERARRIAGVEADLAELDLLIGELLAFTRLRGAERAERVDVDAAEIVAEVAEETRRLVRGRDVVAHAPALPMRADRRLVLRALRNLATNAVRHGEGAITIRAEARGDDVAFVVTDQGPGIPEGSRALVVQPFVRLDPSRADGGLGLGLALVHRIATLHGGHLEIDDGPGGGARVTLTLPRAG